MIKICPNCNQEFKSTYVSNKFCNSECLKQYKVKQANIKWSEGKQTDRNVKSNQRLQHPWSGSPISNYRPID